MAHGSSRGSRPGEYRGGRSRGVPNKKTVGRRLALMAAGVNPDAAALPLRLQPLEFMLDVVNDVNLPLDVRLNAARWSAPYVHHHKGQIDINGISQPLLVQVIRFADGEQLEPPRPVLDMGKVVEVDAAEENRRGG
jgi:hypothetical protein